MFQFTEFITYVSRIKPCQLLLCSLVQYWFALLQISNALLNQFCVQSFYICKYGELANCSCVPNIKPFPFQFRIFFLPLFGSTSKYMELK